MVSYTYQKPLGNVVFFNLTLMAGFIIHFSASAMGMVDAQTLSLFKTEKA